MVYGRRSSARRILRDGLFASKPPVPPIRRLAFCITDLDAGGAERALVQIVVRLAQLGWEPKVFCLSGPGAMVAPLEQAGIPVECLGIRSATDWPRLRQLRRGLRAWQPAVLQTFMFHGNLAGRWAARYSNGPVVISGLRVAERDAPWRMRLDRWTQRWVAMNVCVSRGVADFAVREMGLSPQKVTVIPNGVDASHFANAAPDDLRRFGIPAGSRVLCCIGRLHPQKGPDLLLAALAPRLSREPNLHLLLIGEGPLRGALEAEAARAGVASQVHLPGRVDDVAGILKASLALVLPSRWEGMPNVVLEAMAAGRPVIATRVEGSDELVRDGETGYLCNVESPEALAAAIERLLSAGERSAEFGRRSKAIIKEEFTWDSSARSYDLLYRRCLGM